MNQEEAEEGLNYLFLYHGIEHILNTLAKWKKAHGDSSKEQILKWVSDNCTEQEAEDFVNRWSWGGLR